MRIAVCEISEIVRTHTHTHAQAFGLRAMSVIASSCVFYSFLAVKFQYMIDVRRRV